MRVTRLIEITVILGIASNAIALAVFFGLRSQTGLYRLGERMPIPSGYLLNGIPLTKLAAPCYLLRMTADGCPFCRQDQPQFTALGRAASRAQCQSLLVSPKVGDLGAADGGALQYIDLNLARSLNPYLVPQTLLLDRHGTAVWFRAGAMNATDLQDATRALAGLP